MQLVTKDSPKLGILGHNSHKTMPKYPGGTFILFYSKHPVDSKAKSIAYMAPKYTAIPDLYFIQAALFDEKTFVVMMFVIQCIVQLRFH